MDFNEIAVFVKVAQLGSFSAAARTLGLPVSTVSTRVARLEKRLGVTLLQRTTRRIRLTEAGAAYFRHAATGFDHVAEAESAVSVATGEVKGRLRVTAPADFGDILLARLITQVRTAHPGIDIELVLTDHYLDLVAEGVDVAIRAGALRDSTLIAKKVGVACWAPFASPDYLASAPPLSRPQDLRRHRCVQFTPLGQEAWILYAAKGSVNVPMRGHLLVNDFGVVRALARMGEGVALLPTYFAGVSDGAGGLTRVLPDWHARADPVHLVYPHQRFVPPRLRAFVDVAAEVLTRSLA